MNNISSSAKLGKNVKIGNNNIIGDNVIISDNVVIGSNNKFFANNIIYDNVEIGDGNVFLDGGIIGEHPVNMDEFIDKVYNGVKIGNNNYFHYNTVVSGGTTANKTIIGDNNKISRNVYIAHDCIITNNVHIYPKVFVCGHCTLMPYSGVGVNASLRQFSVLGSYSFIGMGTPVTKNIFPYFIYAGNRYLRMNTKRVPEEFHKYEIDLKKLLESYKILSKEALNESISIYPEQINKNLRIYFKDYIL
jgi:UDP-N-acetylglucosamine acyltransferase